jgi:hypothetical protein
MLTKLLGLAALASVIALSGTPPARALCNPGTPNCIKIDAGHAKAMAQVNQGNGNFNCDPGPAGICSDDIPSGSSASKTSTSLTPRAGTVTVAPPIQ